MAKETNTRDLESLAKATEETRKKLQDTWKKVENLQAAIDSAQESFSTKTSGKKKAGDGRH